MEIDAEATRLGRELSREKRRADYKSTSFLCKRVLLGFLARQKKGDRGGLKRSLGPQRN